MISPRTRLASAVTGVALVASLGLVSSSPAQADPDVQDVKTRVDSLYHEAEQASERYNDVKIQLDDLKADLGSVKADEKRAEKSLDAMRREARRSVLRQYGSGDLGVVSQVATAGDASFVCNLCGQQGNLNLRFIDDQGLDSQASSAFTLVCAL